MYQTASFPGCCGARILFYMENDSAIKTDANLLAQTDFHQHGLNLIILNNRQKERLHDILIKNGWVVLIDKVQNSYSGNDLTLYGFSRNLIHMPSGEVYGSSEVTISRMLRHYLSLLFSCRRFFRRRVGPG